ncbi:GFA family protein [Dokdonella ginsengisoli]|uniref:GFA family protein n=1 Tax=Dokdonella ginsengisoli TaxID=363846 RepID=A0ABV9QWM4_9GAMM
MHRGSCLCGAVSFEVDADLRAPDACHCSMCRRQSGHFWASTDVLRTDLRFIGADPLAWFRSSEKVRRGFCATCGSVLFWDAQGKDTISVSMGAFDSPTGTRLEKHIFVADKGDYYDIGDALPQNPR